MPSPAARFHHRDLPFSYLGCEHRTKTSPPNPHRLMAHTDATFMQQGLLVSKRKWDPNIKHYRQPMIQGLVPKSRNGLRLVIRWGYETAPPLKRVLKIPPSSQLHQGSEILTAQAQI